jgi:hypothetical protein
LWLGVVFVTGGHAYAGADSRMPDKFGPTLIFASLLVVLKRSKCPENDQN